jgi:hypothetical protein
MLAERNGDTITTILTEGEYLMVLSCLRELIGEMHEKDFPPRIGVSRDVVSSLALQFGAELEKLGIEE